MKRNCDLDLGLQPRNPHNSIYEPLKFKQPHHHQNGRHCLFDVTELQARVIIWLASREMEERMGNGNASATPLFSLQSQALMMNGGIRGLSMKRSLQSFLHKRNKRTQQSPSL